MSCSDMLEDPQKDSIGTSNGRRDSVVIMLGFLVEPYR